MGLPEDIVRMEQALRDLIIKYEQYFIGIEKREPLPQLEELERCARQYHNVGIANTMLKFRFQSLTASFSLQKQKWSRITRLIEEGKFLRDRAKQPRQQVERREAPAPIPDTRERELERIYQEYLAARKACNLPTQNVSKEKIAAAIAQQRPIIADKYHCDAIEFSVVIEEGKPRIKARPKSS